jgi:hypothetical protein
VEEIFPFTLSMLAAAFLAVTAHAERTHDEKGATAASRSSGCSAPTALATGQPQPQAGRSAQPALRLARQAPHTTDADQRAHNRDQRIRAEINQPRRDQLRSINRCFIFDLQGRVDINLPVCKVLSCAREKRDPIRERNIGGAL